MNDRLLVRQEDAQGRTRFYVPSIESEAGFQDLMKFVSQDFGCEFGELDRGPGTLVQKGMVGGKVLFFVLSDSTGTQFFAEDENAVGTAERIAKGVEARLREVMRTFVSSKTPVPRKNSIRGDSGDETDE